MKKTLYILIVLAMTLAACDLNTPLGSPTTAPVANATNAPAGNNNPTGTGSGWNVKYFDGATDQMHVWFDQLKTVEPKNWHDFPNVDNPTVGFKSADGLEYGMGERNHCQVDKCNIVVAAREYLLVTADYSFPFGSCAATKEYGCALAIFNVGEVTAEFTNVTVKDGFTLNGRYWNGDTLQLAMWGLMSYTDAAMMNLPTTLNPKGINNAGANCSVPTGCPGVFNRIVITSGNQVLVVAESTASR
jgi:predicted small lipoprotein YifL